MMASTTRVALRIDVDTYRGTRDGVPAMLDDLASAGVRASFFFTLGPDQSGRAIRRVFTTPGFAAKMWRTNAPRMYGWKAALYGTLLPAPMIGRRCVDVLRRCQAARHEIGLHAWNHAAWQNQLPRLGRAAVDAMIDRGVAAFEGIFGAPPRAFAAPGWLSTDAAWLALDARGFDYVSVSRGAVAPYRPRVQNRTLAMLEIPTTLSTLDEDLGRSGTTAANYVDRLVARYRPGATEVVTVHAETEGLAFRDVFRALIERHRQLGVRTCTLGTLADETRDNAPSRDVQIGRVPGRAGPVTLAGAL